MVKLTNDRDATITFSYIGEKNPGSGSAVYMQQVEVSKIANSNFIVGYVPATDYSELGTFMVAKLKTIETMDMQTDSEYTVVDGGVSYAVLPESFVGIHSGLTHAHIIDFSFWYGGNVALIASATKDGFTKQDEQELIAILSSFRIDDGLIYNEDRNIISGVDFGDDGDGLA